VMTFQHPSRLAMLSGFVKSTPPPGS
jgi:hypothetical protein